jgi:hypothetical protein
VTYQKTVKRKEKKLATMVVSMWSLLLSAATMAAAAVGGKESAGSLRDDADRMTGRSRRRATKGDEAAAVLDLVARAQRGDVVDYAAELVAKSDVERFFGLVGEEPRRGVKPLCSGVDECVKLATEKVLSFFLVLKYSDQRVGSTPRSPNIGQVS